MREEQPLAKLPRALRNMMSAFFLRKSVLGRAIRKSQGTFLGGLNTYLLKVGADNLGSAYATSIDRRIAAALPCMAMRWRLQDMARLLADAMTDIARVDAQPRPAGNPPPTEDRFTSSISPADPRWTR